MSLGLLYKIKTVTIMSVNFLFLKVFFSFEEQALHSVITHQDYQYLNTYKQIQSTKHTQPTRKVSKKQIFHSFNI